MFQSGSATNINVLRMTPCATLVRALVSCLMLVSIGAAYLNAPDAASHGKDMFMSAGFLGILTVLGYMFAIYCICGITDMSDMFRVTFILLVAAVILSSVGILARAGVIYENALGDQRAGVIAEIVYNIIYIAEKCVYAIAVYVFMKGMADLLKSTDVTGRVESARHIEVLGTIYAVSGIVLNTAAVLAYVKEAGNAVSLMLASVLTGAVLEIAIFFVQRKAVAQIWQYYYDMARVKQGLIKKERG